MKYGNWTFGQMEALLNRLGEENACGLLKDELICIFKPLSSSLFQRDMTKEGYKLFEGQDEPDPIEVARFELVPFLKDGEKKLTGFVVACRADRELRANYGQRQAEYFLAHQEQIPEEFQEYALVFTRTIWWTPKTGQQVVCLAWGGERWVFGTRLLDGDFDDDCRLVRPRE